MNRLILPIAVCLLALTACSYPDERSLNIPEGLASHTLKEFAKQANVEIVFNTPSVSEVRTNPVVGKMTPRLALELMLSGTHLVFERDPETGAYAVTSNQILDTVAKEGSVLGKK
ncbi:STN domain-containing protein [Opitutaceae bacterium]|nr:STN domain-containing protein [Opitutaceae bacterium]